MTSKQYKMLVAGIVRGAMRKFYPGIKQSKPKHGTEPGPGNEIGSFVARAIHARMYGANVEGADSPLYHNERNVTNEVSV